MTESRLSDCEVLLLSAGLGTRLRPLTDTVPKPLVKVGTKTLIERNLELLAAAGAERVFINLHYKGEMIRTFVGDGSRWGITVEYSEEPLLLDTGGAIKAIEDRLEGSHLLTLNSDVLLDPNFSFADLIKSHTDCPNEPSLTMVLRPDPDHKSYGSIGINDEGRVVSFLDESYTAVPPRRLLMYTGIQVMNRSVIAEMPPKGSIFSLTKDTIRELLRNGGYVGSFVFEGFWSDVGTPERLEQASKEMAEKFLVFGKS